MQLPDKEVGCHRTGFEKNCRDLVVSGRCNRWMHIRGANPQGGELDHYRCVDDWIPTLQLENALVTRQTGAAVESFRNENATVNQVAISALTSLVRVAHEIPRSEPKLITD